MMDQEIKAKIKELQHLLVRGYANPHQVPYIQDPMIKNLFKLLVVTEKAL